MTILLLILLAIAMVGTQLLLGGKEPAFSLPGYGVLALGAVLSVWSLRRLPISRRTLVCIATSVVFFGCIVIRALFSEDHYLARRDLYLALAVLIVYLLVVLQVISPRLRFSLVGVLLVLGVVDTAIGALQYQRGDGFMPFEFLSAVGYGARARGFFGCPNHLAGFLEVVVMLGLSVAFWSAWPWWGRILIGYASAVCGVGLMLTGSRGGYMALAAGLMILACLSALLLNQRGRPSLALALMASVAVGLSAGAWSIQAVLPAVSTVRDKIHSVVSLEAAVVNCRPRLWSSALQQSGLSPVAGTGSGTYLYYGRQFRDPSIQTDPVYAHCDYLQLLGEYGIVGAVGFLLFFGCHLVSGWKAFWQQSSLYGEAGGGGQGGSVALTIGALCGTVAIAVHSCVDFNLHIPANTLFVAFVFGMLANPGGEQRRFDPAWMPGWRAVFALRWGFG
ncbi:hypothetical protein CfE428DRAFT_0423 [Chthoniobacter flavus Ellin428]|uniref:O-antigen ligase-related domain-containing protein n=1 Tax=Chthoniobacter flavus Ellin428 TaxID=497964 RepID=B4CUR0_9BACT|nr:O-antigen ligase family protein [Chthoniobacter flavus]EDY22298.1 hypothetical protein CfE428DRAFT_0423 [Chthoniobacter flavus Ellin428]